MVSLSPRWFHLRAKPFVTYGTVSLLSNYFKEMLKKGIPFLNCSNCPGQFNPISNAVYISCRNVKHPAAARRPKKCATDFFRRFPRSFFALFLDFIALAWETNKYFSCKEGFIMDRN